MVMHAERALSLNATSHPQSAIASHTDTYTPTHIHTRTLTHLVNALFYHPCLYCDYK